MVDVAGKEIYTYHLETLPQIVVVLHETLFLNLVALQANPERFFSVCP